MKDQSRSPRSQRSAFILVDGKRSLDQVLAATAPMGVTREDVDKLFEFRLIEDAAPQQTAAEEAAARGPSHGGGNSQASHAPGALRGGLSHRLQAHRQPGLCADSG